MGCKLSMLGCMADKRDTEKSKPLETLEQMPLVGTGNFLVPLFKGLCSRHKVLDFCSKQVCNSEPIILE